MVFVSRAWLGYCSPAANVLNTTGFGSGAASGWHLRATSLSGLEALN